MIEKDLVGKEDINFGTGTVQRRSQTGSTISITQVNAGHLPIADSGGNFTGTTVEAALAECLTQVGAGSSAADYLNNSGTSRVLGDVVVVSTGAVEAFTTTTTVGHASVLGVVHETIASGSRGKVVTGGYCPEVKVTNATSIGSFLRTSSTAAQAISVTTAQQGVFGIALSSTAGAGTVSAFLFGVLGQSYLPIAGGNLTGTLGLFKGTDVASASALNPWASSNVGNYFDITGTNAVTSIATSGNVGTVLFLHFDAGLTLTHHATNLILPGAVDLATGAGDELIFIEYASGQWRCCGYVDASTTGTGNVVRATSPTLTSPTITGTIAGTPTITTPTITVPVIADLSSMNHNHSTTATGGVFGTSAFKCKIIDIGDWNMDTTASVNVAHGLTFANIRAVNMTIRNDANDTFYPVTTGAGVATGEAYLSCQVDATNVVCTRMTGSAFDAVAFDSTSYNRGWVTIWYV